MRLDALVVHGHATAGDAASIYMPQTFRFPGIKSQDRLPTGENGLLIFYGKALHFWISSSQYPVIAKIQKT